MSDVTQALVSLYPNCEWTIEDGMYENLTWTDTNTPKPTLEELTAKYEEIVAAQPMKNLRRERDKRLAEVDWIFSGDYQLSEEEWGAWTTYRQALRDLPSTTENPANPMWPEKPLTEWKDARNESPRRTQLRKVQSNSSSECCIQSHQTCRGT